MFPVSAWVVSGPWEVPGDFAFPVHDMFAEILTQWDLLFSFEAHQRPPGGLTGGPRGHVPILLPPPTRVREAGMKYRVPGALARCQVALEGIGDFENTEAV